MGVFVLTSKEKIHRVEILDNTGKFLMQAENRSKFDISSLPQGLYIIRILKDNIVSSKKIYKL